MMSKFGIIFVILILVFIFYLWLVITQNVNVQTVQMILAYVMVVKIVFATPLKALVVVTNNF